MQPTSSSRDPPLSHGPGAQQYGTARALEGEASIPGPPAPTSTEAPADLSVSRKAWEPLWPRSEVCPRDGHTQASASPTFPTGPELQGARGHSPAFPPSRSQSPGAPHPRPALSPPGLPALPRQRPLIAGKLCREGGGGMLGQPQKDRWPAFGSHCTPPLPGLPGSRVVGLGQGSEVEASTLVPGSSGQESPPPPRGLTLGCRRPESPQGPELKAARAGGGGKGGSRRGGQEGAGGVGTEPAWRSLQGPEAQPGSPAWQPAEWRVRGTAWGSPVLWPVSPLPAAGWEGGSRTLPLLRGHSVHPYLPTHPHRNNLAFSRLPPTSAAPQGPPQTALGLRRAAHASPGPPRAQPSGLPVVRFPHKEAREAG